MTAIGSSAGNRPSLNAHHAAPGQSRPDPQPDDVHAMHSAFAKADTRLPLAQERGRMGKLPTNLKADVPGGADAQAEQRAGASKGRNDDRGQLDADRGSQQDGQQGLLASAQQPVVPIAAPTMPGPHVDPSAFAQLLSQLWLRERSKGAKEVRVSFGQDAWPATGARVVRNAGGTLDIQLHVADGGAAYDGATLDGLQDRLASQGLAVGALQLETGALT